MNTRLRAAALLAATIVTATAAHAQYWQLTNQVTNMAGTALSAGMRYRGSVDGSYLVGVGSNRADVIEVSTTQGCQCSRLFFMGLGLGIDILNGHSADGVPLPPPAGHSVTRTATAIPLYTDFRLTPGRPQAIGMTADLRIGAAFLAGGRYVRVGEGYLLNSQCFYLKPTLGMRIPLMSGNSRVALNVGVSYLLLSSTTWYVSNSSLTLSAIGVNVGVEW